MLKKELELFFKKIQARLVKFYETNLKKSANSQNNIEENVKTNDLDFDDEIMPSKSTTCLQKLIYILKFTSLILLVLFLAYIIYFLRIYFNLKLQIHLFASELDDLDLLDRSSGILARIDKTLKKTEVTTRAEREIILEELKSLYRNRTRIRVRN